MAEPKAANVAKAEAMLFGDGGASNEGSATAPAVEKTVQPSEEQREAAQILEGSQRTTRVHRPNRAADRARDVLGRFEPDGTPKKPEAPAKKPDAAAEGKAAEGAPEVPADTKPEAEETKPAPTRAEKAREQLAKLRADRKAREEQARARGEQTRSTSEIEAEREAARKEREQAAAERARWEAARKDPIAGFKELGLEPSQAFLELAEAAKKAGTPEARIEALEALLVQSRKESDERVRALENRISAQTEAAQRSQAEAEFMAEAKPDAYPYAHAYLKAEAAKQGLDARALWMRAADHIADEQRASGKTPSYKSIATAIEEYAKEVVLEMLAALPPEPGSTAEKAPATKARETPAVPTETKGKSTITIGNEHTSTRISNGKRRMSLTDRQRAAEKLLG